MKGFEKLGLVNIGDAIRLFFKVTKAPWQIGIHKNL